MGVASYEAIGVREVSLGEICVCGKTSPTVGQKDIKDCLCPFLGLGLLENANANTRRLLLGKRAFRGKVVRVPGESGRGQACRARSCQSGPALGASRHLPPSAIPPPIRPAPPLTNALGFPRPPPTSQSRKVLGALGSLAERARASAGPRALTTHALTTHARRKPLGPSLPAAAALAPRDGIDRRVWSGMRC